MTPFEILTSPARPVNQVEGLLCESRRLSHAMYELKRPPLQRYYVAPHICATPSEEFIAVVTNTDGQLVVSWVSLEDLLRK
jgi:hypothetical protein